jgi:hypothetical protein
LENQNGKDKGLRNGFFFYFGEGYWWGFSVGIWGGKLKNYFCLFLARFAVLFFGVGVFFKTTPPDHVHKITTSKQAPTFEKMKAFSFSFCVFLLALYIKV